MKKGAIQKSVRLYPELIDKIEKIAKEQNRSWNNTVETILKERVEND
jgi:hypothetical protein